MHAFKTAQQISSRLGRPSKVKQSTSAHGLTPIFITTSAHGPMPICVVASAHELTIQIGDIPNTSTYDLATQIHGVPNAHKPTTQIGRQQKNLKNNGN